MIDNSSSKTPIDPNKKLIGLEPIKNPQGTTPTKGSGGPSIQNMGILAAYYLILRAATIASHTTVVHAKGLAANGDAQKQLDDEFRRIQWHSVPKEKYHEKHEKGGAGMHFHRPHVRGSKGFTGHSANFVLPGNNGNKKAQKNRANTKNTNENSLKQTKNQNGKNNPFHTNNNFGIHIGPIHASIGKHGGSFGVGSWGVHASKHGGGFGAFGWSFNGWGGKNVKTPANLTAINEAEWANEQAQGMRQILTQQMNLMQQNAQVGETQVDVAANSLSKKMQADSAILQILKDLTYKAMLRQQPQ